MYRVPMSLSFITPGPEHVPQLARICHEAFCSLHDRHGVPRDFLSPEMTHGLLEGLVRSPAYFGVAAVLDGRIVGSNFMATPDPVAAIGPITVDPTCQARGVGRALMQAAMDHARERGLARVRLFQETINAASLSLYTSLGFAWRDSAVIVEMRSGGATDGSVRDLRLADIDATAALCARAYGHSRRHETEAWLGAGFPAFARERDGKLTGYLLPGFFGHGMMESRADALALIAHAAGRVPPMFGRFICPLSESDLYRDLLGAGHRTMKMLSYMSLGPFEPPTGVWLPSIGC